MAKVPAAFTTYLAVGNREDLSNAIYNIDPFDTPVMSAVRRRNVKNRIFDWQTEFLPTAGGAAGAAQIEGFVLTPQNSTPTLRQNNQAQINERDATVSGSQEEVDAAGKANEMAHQMAIISKVLKSDIELALCSRNQRVDGVDNTSARQTEAICHWLARATFKGGAVNGAIVPNTVTASVPTTPGSVAGDSAFTAVAGGSQVALTEQMLGDAMQQAYSNGASPTLWVLPAAIKRTASAFVGRSTTQVLVGKTEVVSTVDVFATDFGRVKCIPSRWVPTDVGLLIDPDYIAVAFFRSFRQYMMARTGDAEVRMIVVEWGVEMRNSLAHMLFNGVKA